MSQQQCTILPKRYDTRNRQHVLLMRDTFCTGERIERCSYGSRKLAMYRMHVCASARFRDRCIVSIDVPCVLHLCVHVWVRHTSPPHPRDWARLAPNRKVFYIICICSDICTYWKYLFNSSHLRDLPCQ